MNDRLRFLAHRRSTTFALFAYVFALVWQTVNTIHLWCTDRIPPLWASEFQPEPHIMNAARFLLPGLDAQWNVHSFGFYVSTACFLAINVLALMWMKDDQKHMELRAVYTLIPAALVVVIPSLFLLPRMVPGPQIMGLTLLLTAYMLRAIQLRRAIRAEQMLHRFMRVTYRKAYTC